MAPPHPPTADHSLVAGASRAAGALLESVFASVARLRPAVKPLHPKGKTLGATITRTGVTPAVGVPWIDETGVDRAQVRLSRAVGLPAGWPDIYGLAIRVPTAVEGGHGDLLLATTGRGKLGRFVLLPARTSTTWTYSTLIPYRTPSGPLLLAAEPDGQDAFALACGRPRGPWRTFGRVVIESASTTATGGSDDVGPAFDPVLNQIPGLAYYPWAATLREGSYRAARRSRKIENSAG